MNTASITFTGKMVNVRDEQGMQIPCTTLFKCTILFKGEENYIEVLKRQLNLYPVKLFVRLKIVRKV